MSGESIFRWATTSPSIAAKFARLGRWGTDLQGSLRI